MAVPFFDRFNATDGRVFQPGSEGADYDDTSPWSAVTIAGRRLPGTCTITGAATHRVDVQRASGVDGGTLIERGYDPSKFDIDVKIWTLSQWNIWLEIRPNLLRRSGKLDVRDAKAKKTAANSAAIAATALAATPISNPLLDVEGIGACLVESIQFPRPGPEFGSWIITIKCMEYVAPAKVNATKVLRGNRENVRSVDDKAPSPAVNKPTSPKDAGDGGPNGAPKISHGSR